MLSDVYSCIMHLYAVYAAEKRIGVGNNIIIKWRRGKLYGWWRVAGVRKHPRLYTSIRERVSIRNGRERKKKGINGFMD